MTDRIDAIVALAAINPTGETVRVDSTVLIAGVDADGEPHILEVDGDGALITSGGGGSLTAHEHTASGDGGDNLEPATLVIPSGTSGLPLSSVPSHDHSGDVGDGGQVALTHASAILTADQTLNVADTPTDLNGCSVSLAAGTWLIFGQAKFNLGGTVYAQLVIANSSNTYYSAMLHSGTNAEGSPAFCVAIVTHAVTTTYKLRAQAGGTTTLVDKDNGTGQIYTQIVAVRIG